MNSYSPGEMIAVDLSLTQEGNDRPRASKSHWFTVLLAISLALLPFNAQAKGISIGIRAPDKPYMWAGGKSIDELNLSREQKTRWQVLESNLDHMRTAGGDWNLVYARQWLDTDREFSRLKRVVEEHKKRNIGVVLRLFEDPKIYKDMPKTPSPGFGYDQAYFNWVQKVAREFNGEILCYLVGNEIEIDLAKSYGSAPNIPKPLFINYSKYSKVLFTAAKAIRTVDTGTRIANGGFSDKSLAYAVAEDLYNREGISEAHDFWEQWKGRGGIEVEGKLSLMRQLSSGDVKRRTRFVRQALRNPEGNDMFQLHYYGGWRALPPMLDWISSEMAKGEGIYPIVVPEAGFGVRRKKRQGADGKIRTELDFSEYSEAEHADNTVKQFAIMLGSGIEEVMYWSMRDVDNRGAVARLFASTTQPTQFVETPVNRSFAFMSKTLSGMVAGTRRLPDTPGVWEYSFSGDQEISVVWSDEKDLRQLVSSAKRLIDIEGIEYKKAELDQPLYGPIYVVW